jgi:hypothetical protein
VRSSGNIDHRLSAALLGSALLPIFPFPYLHTYVLRMKKQPHG